jgi:DNA-binding LytR/AlgR family response regulator
LLLNRALANDPGELLLGDRRSQNGVLEAGNAQSAIDILKRDDRIDLLFTDIVLPGGMNGSDLARSAGTMPADMKVLFTSGFPEGAFGENGALPPGAILLGKPYRKDELARRLRESLAA